MNKLGLLALATTLVLGTGCTLTSNLKQPTVNTPSAVNFQDTSLTSLDLSHKDIDAVPAEIGRLLNLVHLDLSDNQLTGLPAELGKLKKLETLDVSNNQLTGLPLELGNLSNLQTLDLRGNPYSTYDLDLIRARLPETQILVDE